jgi:hypothetical protein
MLSSAYCSGAVLKPIEPSNAAPARVRAVAQWATPRRVPERKLVRVTRSRSRRERSSVCRVY